MDWKALKNKALDLSVKAMDVSSKALEKGKELAEKAKDTGENLKEKAEEFSEKIIDKKEEVSSNSKSFLDKAKDFGNKAVDSTTGILAKTAPMLKIIADYKKIKDDKNLAILFLKKDTEESKKLQLMMPLFVKNCWTNMVTFKVVDVEDSKELAQNFDLEIVPSLIVFQLGEEKLRTGGLEEIKKYFKDFLI